MSQSAFAILVNKGMEQQKRGYVTTDYYLSNFTEVSSLFHLKLTLCPLGIGKLRIATGMLITNH